MLSKQDLLSNFSEIVELGDGVFRCKDVLPKTTFFYYVKIGSHVPSGDDLLIVSENRIDDEFADSIFLSLRLEYEVSGLELRPIPANRYKFPLVIVAPANYHAYFKGRLDEKRGRLTLCMPIYRCEFSGTESVDVFFSLRREIVPTLDWERDIHPKIELRFDNSKTRSGTGNGYVFAKLATVMREIDNLNGVSNGFVEVKNYAGQVVEILSPEKGKYYLIRDRKDEDRELVDRSALQGMIWTFLTTE